MDLRGESGNRTVERKLQTQGIQARDFFTLTSRELTDEGYLIAPATLAMADVVQRYTADELGLTGEGVDANRIFRLYRPALEVMRPESLKTFENQPVTDDHPPRGTVITAENWAQFAKGHVRDVHADGPKQRAKVLIKDAGLRDKLIAGKAQLSNGYRFDLDMTPGTSPSGEAYDGIMTNIIGNHTAVVDLARGGRGCRVDDHQTGEATMATKSVRINDSVSIELEADKATAVEMVLADLRKEIKAAQDATTSKVTALDASAKEVEALKTAATKIAADHAKEVADLKAKIPTDAQLDELAAKRQKVIADAKPLAPEAKADGKTLTAFQVEVINTVVAADEAMKPVVTAVLRGVAMDKATPADIDAVFTTVVATHTARGGQLSVADQESETAARIEIGDAIAGHGGGTQTRGKPRDVGGRESQMKRSANAWKGEKAEA